MGIWRSKTAVYAQDKWAATNNFTLTYGLRLDIPVFFDTPMENKDFNDWAAKHNYDLKTNRSLSFAPMVSPRVGFRWDINNDRRFILRGGAGVFTGRIPFVWVSNNFSGTGVQISSYDSNYSNTKGLELILDPNKQESNAQKLGAITGNQDVAVCSKNFKFAQNLRLNLGFDFDLLGINWTAVILLFKLLVFSPIISFYVIERFFRSNFELTTKNFRAYVAAEVTFCPLCVFKIIWKLESILLVNFQVVIESPSLSGCLESLAALGQVPAKLLA